MVTLALDTCTPRGGAAVARDAELLAAVEGDPRRTHGERQPADVFRALAEAGLTLGQVGRLAVVTGPGGFTGLRVGIATIQGLALATGLRVVVTSAFEALARAALGAGGTAIQPGHRIAVLMDAARGDRFGQAWLVRDAGGRLEVSGLDEPAVGRAPALWRRWVVSGDEASWWGVVDPPDEEEAAVHLRGRARVVSAPPSLAPTVALQSRFVPDGETVRPHGLQPIYVRRPDAVIARERREADAGGGS